MARIEVTSVLDRPPRVAADLIARPSTFLHVARPVFTVANRDVLPDRFAAGDHFELRLRAWCPAAAPASHRDHRGGHRP